MTFQRTPLEERARTFLREEDGVLGSTYQIMAAFAKILIAEEREACATLADAGGDCALAPGESCCNCADHIAAAIRARVLKTEDPNG